MAVKAVALGRIRHMRHGMHACSHSLAVVCNPYGAPVPRKALQALHYGGVFFCYRLAVRMIPAAEAPCAEAFAGTHISHRKLGALVQPIAAALEPVQQHYAALELGKRGVFFCELVGAVEYGIERLSTGDTIRRGKPRFFLVFKHRLAGSAIVYAAHVPL